MKATEMIDDLLKDPVEFDKKGRAYQLLQHYFRGFSIETLRPLLSHHHDSVRRAAIFIATELGEQVHQIIDDIVPLVHDPDLRIAWDAMESIMLCSTKAKPNYFFVIVRKLEDPSDSLRRLAMRLIARANDVQIENAMKQFDKPGSVNALRTQGLSILSKSKMVDTQAIQAMLDSNILLLRYYGAIASSRYAESNPELLVYASTNDDPDVSRFALEALKTSK